LVTAWQIRSYAYAILLIVSASALTTLVLAAHLTNGLEKLAGEVRMRLGACFLPRSRVIEAPLAGEYRNRLSAPLAS
jgi:hypothetical protein